MIPVGGCDVAGESWQLTRGAAVESKIRHKAVAASAPALASASLLIHTGRQEVSLKKLAFISQSHLSPRVSRGESTAAWIWVTGEDHYQKADITTRE